MTRPSNPDRDHAHGQGSFFGRRKGHKLRALQADLIENLLPRLALGIGSRARHLSEIFEGRSTTSGSIGFGGGDI